MDIAFCYESVLPARGGAETYISDLSRRLARDGHRVHLLASRWDESALPDSLVYHPITPVRGPRFLRPWRFGQACLAELANFPHDVSVGFDKTWGQDILYPQGGLHAASQYHNRLKFRSQPMRTLASFVKQFDLAYHSFARLERQQYLSGHKPIIVVNSEMVRRHFSQYYAMGSRSIHMIRSAIDPLRFVAEDRPKRRHQQRTSWGVGPDMPVGLFVAMNYRLKGLAPLIQAAAELPRDQKSLFVIVGHPKTGRYQRLAERLGVQDRFLFLGHRNDPRDAYFAADFLVHPTFYDPCSLVALEALACGLPVLTTRYNGASELLNDPQAGLVIDNPHDSANFSRAIQRLMGHDFRRVLAKNARQVAESWTFEHHYQAMLELFEQTAEAKRAA